MFTSASFEPCLFDHVPALSPGFCASSAGCAITAETSGAAASTEGEFDSSDAFSVLELPPGHTSVSDRVFNLVHGGSPAKAIRLLERELQRADDNRISRVIDLSLRASEDMKRFSMASEAAELDNLLIDWGIEPGHLPKPQTQSPAAAPIHGAPAPAALC